MDKDTYWMERIRQAREYNGVFLRSDKQEVMNWPDCACGKQDPRIPRYVTGQPKDELLQVLGANFADAVIENNPDLAERFLHKIERRSGEILKELAVAET